MVRTPLNRSAGNGTINCGAMRFSRDRIEKLRDGKRMTSFARERARWVRVERDSLSEHPGREFLWAVGTGAGAYFALQRALTTGSAGAWVGALALVAVCVALLVNLLRRQPVLVVHQEDGTSRIAVEGKLSPDEVEELNRRLADELDWPVRPEFGLAFGRRVRAGVLRRRQAPRGRN